MNTSENNIWTRICAGVSGMSTGRAVLIILMINLLLRLLVVLPAKEYSPSHDGCHYMMLGQSLARGEGYSNTVLYAPRLNAERPKAVRDRFPFADFQRPPLYPFLLSVMYRAFGESFFVSLMLNVLMGSMIAALTFLLAMQLSKNRGIAWLAAALISFHPTISKYTPETMLEFTFAVCVLNFFIYLFHFTRKDLKAYMLIPAGILWGLCWYARHEALYVMALPILIELLMHKGLRRGILYFAGIAGVAFASTVPWKLRALNITGDAGHTELKYHLMSGFVDYHEFFCNLIPLPKESIAEFMLSDPAYKITRYFTLLSELLAQYPTQIAGGVLLAFFSIAALVFNTKKISEHAALLVWFACNFGFFALTFAVERFLYALMPVAMIFSAMGIFAILKMYDQRGKSEGNKAKAYAWLAGFIIVFNVIFRAASGNSITKRGRKLLEKIFGEDFAAEYVVNALAHLPEIIFVVISILVLMKILRRGYFFALSKKFIVGLIVFCVAMNFIYGFCRGMREGTKSRYSPEIVEYLQKNAKADDNVMVYRKSYFYGWILDRNVVQMPLPLAKHREYEKFKIRESEEEFYEKFFKMLSVFEVKWIVIKGHIKKDGRVIYTHGWAPEEIPQSSNGLLIKLKDSVMHPRGKFVYNIYTVN